MRLNYNGTKLVQNILFCNDPADNSEKVIIFTSKFKQFLNGSMRILIQRVTRASVTIGEQVHGAIGQGLLVFVGIEEADEPEDVAWLCGKLIKLRIFADEAGVMNRSIEEVKGEILVISQFTLHAQTKKGNRPSYIRAARPETAIPLYEAFVESVSRAMGTPVATGVFGADMQVELINDGPVTLWIDSKNRE